MTDDPLVAVEELAARLGDPDLQIVDATWFMPAEARSGREEYRKAHIPGAVFFDIDAISDRSSDLPHMLPAPEAFAAAAGDLGLRREAEVVVYDGQGIFSAPRVWWMLETMGFPKVRVLDGGLKRWLAQGRPVESGDAQPTPSKLDARFNASHVRDLAGVKSHLQKGDAQVVDARAAARFRGEAPEPRAGLPSGHMPGALNLPWNSLVRDDGTMAQTPVVKAAFQAAGVDLSRPIVTSCGSGVSAAILSLGLARMGVEAPVYDGSWTEWASGPDAEIATGP